MTARCILTVIKKLSIFINSWIVKSPVDGRYISFRCQKDFEIYSVKDDARIILTQKKS